VWIMGKIYGEEIRSDQDLSKATHKNFAGRAMVICESTESSNQRSFLYLTQPEPVSRRDCPSADGQAGPRDLEPVTPRAQAGQKPVSH